MILIIILHIRRNNRANSARQHNTYVRGIARTENPYQIANEERTRSKRKEKNYNNHFIRD